MEINILCKIDHVISLLFFMVFLARLSNQEPLIQVCSTSEYKRVVEDTCSSVYKRDPKHSRLHFHTYTYPRHREYDEEAVRYRRRSMIIRLLRRRRSENYGFSDLPEHCCAIGCPHSVYAEHCGY